MGKDHLLASPLSSLINRMVLVLALELTIKPFEEILISIDAGLYINIEDLQSNLDSLRSMKSHSPVRPHL